MRLLQRLTVGFIIVVVVASVPACATTESSSTNTTEATFVTSGPGTSATTEVVKVAGPCDLLSGPTVAGLLGTPTSPKGEPGAQAPSDWCKWTSGSITVKVQRDTTFLWETMKKDPASTPYGGMPVPAIVHPKNRVAGKFVVGLVGKRTVTVDVEGVDPDAAALKAAAAEALSRQQAQ